MAVYSIDFELSSSQYAWCADSVSLSITGDISIEAWIKLEQLPSSASTFVIDAKMGSEAGTQLSYYSGIDKTTNKLEFLYSASGNWTNYSYAQCNTAFVSGDIGVWIHVAVAVDVSAKAFDFYINGAIQADTVVSSASASIFDGTARFQIGARYDTPASFFDGKIKNARIWNDVRTEAEFDDNKCVENSEFTVGVDNYVDGWSFENTLDSQSGNNDLTGVNSPTFVEDVPACLEAQGPAGVKTINDLAIASVKTINDVAIANVKTINDAS